jgi:hypothetical protein
VFDNLIIELVIVRVIPLRLFKVLVMYPGVEVRAGLANWIGNRA